MTPHLHDIAGRRATFPDAQPPQKPAAYATSLTALELLQYEVHSHRGRKR